MIQHTGRAGPAREGEPVSGQQLHRFLRYSHIYSSAVREVLEQKLLEDVAGKSLTIPQLHLLKLIALNGHHQVGEVAEFLGVSSPAVSKNIDKLERMGLVSRVTSSDDRRATLLSPSDKGRQLVDAYEAKKAAHLRPILDCFSSEEVSEVTHLLERLSVMLFESAKSNEGFCLRCAAYCEDHCPVGHVHGNCPYEKIRGRGSERTEKTP